LFWPKLISSLVIDELRKSSSRQITGLLDMLEGLMKKLPG
jgi:hypothetical protein